MTDKEKMTAVVKALDAKKGADIAVIDVEEKTIIATYFVICSAGSEPQLRSLADAAEDKMAERCVDTLRAEGKPESGWLLLDFGGVVLHVFTEKNRVFYDLERLWSDAPRVDISSLLTED